MTKLKSISISGINKGGISNTSLDISEIDIVKAALLVEGKNIKRLSLLLLKVDNIYSLDIFYI